MQFFTTLFTQGYSGTWFIYFVSLHQGFQTVEIKWETKYYSGGTQPWSKEKEAGHPVHMSLGKLYSWRRPDYTPPEHVSHVVRKQTLRGSKSFKKFARDLLRAGVSNDSKVIFKCHPHGVGKRVDITVNQNFKNFVLTSSNKSFIRKRNNINYDHYRHLVTEEAAERQFEHLDEGENDYDKFGRLMDSCDHCIIDIYKILNKDEDEYKKVLAYINEPALLNWKEEVDSYIKYINLEL